MDIEFNSGPRGNHKFVEEIKQVFTPLQDEFNQLTVDGDPVQVTLATLRSILYEHSSHLYGPSLYDALKNKIPEHKKKWIGDVVREWRDLAARVLAAYRQLENSSNYHEESIDFVDTFTVFAMANIVKNLIESGFY